MCWAYSEAFGFSSQFFLKHPYSTQIQVTCISKYPASPPATHTLLPICFSFLSLIFTSLSLGSWSSYSRMGLCRAENKQENMLITNQDKSLKGEKRKLGARREGLILCEVVGNDSCQGAAFQVSLREAKNQVATEWEGAEIQLYQHMQTQCGQECVWFTNLPEDQHGWHGGRESMGETGNRRGARLTDELYLRKSRRGT